MAPSNQKVTRETRALVRRDLARGIPPGEVEVTYKISENTRRKIKRNAYKDREVDDDDFAGVKRERPHSPIDLTGELDDEMQDDPLVPAPNESGNSRKSRRLQGRSATPVRTSLSPDFVLRKGRLTAVHENEPPLPNANWPAGTNAHPQDHVMNGDIPDPSTDEMISDENGGRCRHGNGAEPAPLPSRAQTLNSARSSTEELYNPRSFVTPPENRSFSQNSFGGFSGIPSGPLGASRSSLTGQMAPPQRNPRTRPYDGSVSWLPRQQADVDEPSMDEDVRSFFSGVLADDFPRHERLLCESGFQTKGGLDRAGKLLFTRSEFYADMESHMLKGGMSVLDCAFVKEALLLRWRDLQAAV